MQIERLVLFSVMIFSCLVCLAQEPDVEFYLERPTEYSDISELLEILSDLEKNPIELNQATTEQLTLLPWISDAMALQITQLRQQMGGFRRIEQLSQIDGIDADLILILKNYITIAAASSNLEDFSFAAKARLSQRFPKPEGIIQGIYSSSFSQIYHRYLLEYQKRLSLGFLLEKDSGEKSLDDLRLYFLKYHDNSNQLKIILGNYRLEFGSGLIFGNPYYFSKSSNPTYSLKRQDRGLIEYKILDENASLEGIAGQVRFKFYQMFLFYSANWLDASLNSDGTVKNFYRSGYHRSASELEKKDQLIERLAGGRFQVQARSNASFGITYYQNWYHRQFGLDRETQYYSPSYQTINSLIGADYHAITGPLNFMGEAALSRNGGYGLVSGVILDANPVKLAFLARKYTQNFISDHGNSFSELSASPRNEKGIYLGLQYNISKNYKLAFYFDRFKFPWATYSIPMPASGRECLLRIEHKPVKQLWLSCQIKASRKEHAFDAYDDMNRVSKIIIPRNQLNARFQVDYHPMKYLTLRHRIEKTWVSYHTYQEFASNQKQHFQGISVYQDISLVLSDNLICTGRITFFDTDSYESRIYQFERDVPGSFTSQVLYDVGNRWYLTIDWKLKNLITASLKFGSIQYYFFDSIGSGLDQVRGNTSNSMKLQIEFTY